VKFLLISLFSVSFAFGFQETIKFNQGSTDIYINAYSENDYFFLDEISIKPGKLQVLDKRQIFKTKKELVLALSKFKKKTKSKFNKRNNSTSETHDVIWNADKEWDLEWEKKFAKWVSENLTEEFFFDYNIKTDCADAAFALRWIFARINGLPAANTLAGSLVIFSHESFKLEWQNLKRSNNWYEDEVFLAALDYLMLHAYTGTLNIDGYPIEMNRDSFLVGTIHLDGGHTMIISEIDYNQKLSAPIWKLSSTVPATVRKLYKEIMVDSEITNKESGGLFRMRWPIKQAQSWSLVPKEEMPLYSMEQYEDEFTQEFSHFTLALINKIGIDFDPKKVIHETVNNITNSLTARVKIVEDAFAFCTNNDCSEGTMNYEEYSTPTRDGRLTALYKTANDLVKSFIDFAPEIDQTLKDKLETTTFTVEGVSKNLLEWQELLENYALSYHPDAPVSARWALSISDIQKTYEERLNSYLKKRQRFLDNANSCRSNPSLCEFDSQLYKETHTYNLDQEMKSKIYKGYKNYEHQFTHFNQAMTIKNIPFLLSDPRLSIDKRNGTNTSQDFDAHIISGDSIIELNDNKMLIDGKIINLNSLETISELANLTTYFFKNIDRLVQMNKESIFLFNTNGDLIKKINIGGELESLQVISQSYLMMTYRLNSVHRIKIFNILDELSVIYDEDFNGSWSSIEDTGIYYEVIDENYASYTEQYNTDGKNIYIYDQNGVLKFESANYSSFVALSNKTLALQDHVLKINEFNGNTCELVVPKEMEFISNYTQHENLITLSGSGMGEAILVDITDCHPKILARKKGYLDVQKLRGEVIISRYGENSIEERLVYKNSMLIDITFGDAFLSHIEGDDFYFIESEEMNFQEYFKINILTGKRVELDKRDFKFSCQQYSNDCEDVDYDFVTSANVTRENQEYQMYSDVTYLGNKVFSFYKVNSNNGEFYEGELKLANYNANMLSNGVYLIYKKK